MYEIDVADQLSLRHLPCPQIHAGRKLLVLDLDETLVHSSFKPVPKCDYILDIVVDGTNYKVSTAVEEL